MESRLTGRWILLENALFNGKIHFLWSANTSVEPPFLKISRLKLQKLLKPCWPSKTESWLAWVVTCWNNFVRIATHSESRLCDMAKSAAKMNSTLVESFQQELSYSEHVYMRPEVNANRFEISNCFEMSFRVHGNLHRDFTETSFQTIARPYFTCANDIF